MGDGNSKKSKLSWSKSLVRRWFSIKSKHEEFQADEAAYGFGGGEVEWRSNFSERELCTTKRSKTDKFIKNTDWIDYDIEPLDQRRIVDVHNYSIFVATWNVGGKSPISNMNLDDWLHASPPADIYVLGFQEIIPLNASNILGVEDSGPGKKWMALIMKTLNNVPGTSGSSGCHTPSLVSNPKLEMNADVKGTSRQKAASFLPLQSFQATSRWNMDTDPSIAHTHLDRCYSSCDHVMFGNRPSDYRPSDYRPSDYSDYRLSDYRSSDYQPSDFRITDIRSSGYRPSDFSRWGSSDEDCGLLDSPSTVLFSPMSCSGATPNDDGYRLHRQSRYCLVVSKQMVGIFLTVWVKKDLKDLVRNVKVSCVERGLMGYLGNKGSISVSMLLHQTSFCFVCAHLTSGQKEGDKLRRNFDVVEILKKTKFPQVNEMDDKSPETIVEHDRIIWLGDLNYRIALPYRSVKALVEMQNWRALLERDQLCIEQKRGHVFAGWNEGIIYFPPTYKYSHNSDRYAGDDMHPKKKRRTPAWCDRILWRGMGLRQLSYVRAESRFSDHRPVYSVFWAEVESIQGRLRRSTISSSRIEVADLLPCSHGYTELCLF
ncbi:hypothetical protein Nepgr_021837 [Nepenthes gracilis]|uniref:Inositol polyphosphate-related phosphatase domain-containing protein n=1 Tax=Nepenthes gracilis TaxID=150966 RepID=A0AAD3XXS6_NEPGR|nr:hypothetical protein Nepgr_021837 [Nepenthes gracilis]